MAKYICLKRDVNRLQIPICKQILELFKRERDERPKTRLVLCYKSEVYYKSQLYQPTNRLNNHQIINISTQNPPHKFFLALHPPPAANFAVITITRIISIEEPIYHGFPSSEEIWSLSRLGVPKQIRSARFTVRCDPNRARVLVTFTCVYRVLWCVKMHTCHCTSSLEDRERVREREETFPVYSE